MSELKIRCSSLGKIMTNPRTKKETLSKTCKTYIQDIFKENEYGIVREFRSRYIDKGIDCETQSIELANEVLEWALPFDAIHGKQHAFENDYITGHTDVCTKTVLADVKTSWDGTTFPMFDEEIPNKDYYFQCMGYLALTGYDKCDLAYCLINTPENMVLDEIRREHWLNDSVWDGDENPEIVAMVRSRHEFDHIPKEKRVKNFVIERDEDVIKSIYERVEQCREYYKQLKTK